jgi:hypothetical protein
MLILGVMLAGALSGCIIGYFIGQSIGFDRGVALAEVAENNMDYYREYLLEEVWEIRKTLLFKTSYYEGIVAAHLLALLHCLIDENDDTIKNSDEVVTAFLKAFPILGQGESNDTIK